MKKTFLIRILTILAIAIFVSNISKAQVPQSINYQAVLRNASGQILQNQNATMKFAVHQATVNGTTVYEETKTTTTNGFGLVNLQIGQGTPTVGTFADIHWGNYDYFLQVSADIDTGYVNLGTTQFITVPYAMVADTVLHGGGISYIGGTGINVSGTTITNSLPDQIIGLTGTGSSTVTGNYPNFTINSPTAIPPNGTASGDLSGTYPSPIVSQIQGIGISNTAPISGQVLQYNGTNWVPANPTIYTINSSNYLTSNPGDDKIINVQGTINLSASFNNWNGSNNQHISGGTFDGGGTQMIDFGSNCIISNTVFNNIQINGGSNVEFVNCKFNNISLLPNNCNILGGQILNSTLNSSSQLGYVTNCNITSSTIPYIKRISNSLMSACTIGGNFLGLVSNNTINSCVVNLTGNFTGNSCDETQVNITNATNTSSISENNFLISTLTGVIDVNLGSSSSPTGINITGNTFVGNTNYPTTRYIRITGNFGGTRGLVKINNNVAIGGSAVFVYPQYTGTADLMVNDNDLMNTGGLGVTNNAIVGFVYARNNQIH